MGFLKINRQALGKINGQVLVWTKQNSQDMTTASNFLTVFSSDRAKK